MKLVYLLLGAAGVINVSADYTWHAELLTYANAELACEAEGRHLVSIVNIVENREVFNFVEQQDDYDADVGFWIGLRDGLGDTFDWESEQNFNYES
eukprot:CAMPEP_0113945664 /NCGR_PEP_ID=MMETSP1339-20121228/49290_1 /TAXON_ID=94617 /ORGANISM="Fibrocapsa japonica" /LENGTH=95 /DNA_ID=CAMNT_0000951349 /DNA_START=1 /DNA_END=284 /DNA_ORIENTATION=- /assembly_acc=CAM_ASM_000762